MDRENNNKAFEIASLILAYLQHEISPEEQQKLDSWLEESEENRCLFGQMVDEEMQIQEVRKMLSRNLPEAWESVQHKRRRNTRKRIVYFSRIAVMIALTIGAILFMRLQVRQMPIQTILDESLGILPGRPMARLTVADGTSYLLDSAATAVLPNTEIRNGNEIVFQEADSVVTTKIQYSKLEIPRGGEYKIILSDGTRIYLNSETELIFPEDFSNSRERKVYLKGEGYFEVAKNKEKPFIVDCGQYEVKVLGTEFNISNYSNDSYSHTTLKEGKVEIIRNGRETILVPGQHAKWQDGRLEVKKVNVENYTTWMNENFRFESQNVDEILKRIARWYVVDIFYTNSSVKDYHFSGFLPRYANIEDVLELLSLTTNIRFEVKGKTVVVGTK